MSLIYRLLAILFLPAIFVYTLRRANKDGDSRYFWQRLGRKIRARADHPLWVHCASVGEVSAARPLILRLIKEYPQLSFVLTTQTPTAAKLVETTLPESVTHVYLPFDSGGAVKRFLRHIQPRAGLILETEIWPRLFAEARRRDIPLIVVNGRLTKKTLATPRWVRAIFKRALEAVRMVLARSEEDARGYRQLGVAPSRIKVLGNIKFARTGLPRDDLPRLVKRGYWLAASTHNDEERQLAGMIRSRGEESDLLVIVPRHPERGAAIEGQLRELGIEVAVRSRQDAITGETQIYLADTLGEMADLMQHANFVFMGGSLVPVGGHNLLEPAALGKAIVCGPHLDNFSQEAALLRSADALIEVANIEALAEVVNRLSASDQQASELGQAAAQAMTTQANVLDGYIDALRRFIPLV